MNDILKNLGSASSASITDNLLQIPGSLATPTNEQSQNKEKEKKGGRSSAGDFF